MLGLPGLAAENLHLNHSATKMARLKLQTEVVGKGVEGRLNTGHTCSWRIFDPALKVFWASRFCILLLSVLLLIVNGVVTSSIPWPPPRNRGR